MLFNEKNIGSYPVPLEPYINIYSLSYRTRPSSDYIRRNPIPPPSQQPPHVPLRDTHPFGTVYHLGLCNYSDHEEAAARSFSLLPPEESGPHSLGENNHPFLNDTPESTTWYTLETTVPFLQRNVNSKSDEFPGSCILRPTASSPLISIQHEVSIQLLCQYTHPDSGVVAKEKLSFSVPIKFAHFASDPQQYQGFAPLPENPEMSACGPSLPVPEPYAHNLPAYSQLFDRNGDRKIDYSIPLPLYTPSSCSDSSPTPLETKQAGESEPLLSSEIIS